MNLTLTPNRELRKVIQTNTGAESNLCWACGSCDNECPINVAANRLSPRKIVRMANYGLLDELFGEPEIWY
jgi:heterodisulfide reductase subunit C